MFGSRGEGITYVVYIHGLESKDIGTTLRPRYMPYSHMEQLGRGCLRAFLCGRTFMSCRRQHRLRLEAMLPEAACSCHSGESTLQVYCRTISSAVNSGFHVPHIYV